MMKDVYFTPQAEMRLGQIVEYLENIWGKSQKDKFMQDVIHCINLVCINPELFPLFEDNIEVRRCVISTYNCLFYRVKNDQIQILAVWDNRMDPATLKSILSQSY